MRCHMPKSFADEYRRYAFINCVAKRTSSLLNEVDEKYIPDMAAVAEAKLTLMAWQSRIINQPKSFRDALEKSREKEAIMDIMRAFS